MTLEQYQHRVSFDLNCTRLYSQRIVRLKGCTVTYHDNITPHADTWVILYYHSRPDTNPSQRVSGMQERPGGLSPTHSLGKPMCVTFRVTSVQSSELVKSSSSFAPSLNNLIVFRCSRLTVYYGRYGRLWHCLLICCVSLILVSRSQRLCCSALCLCPTTRCRVFQPYRIVTFKDVCVCVCVCVFVLLSCMCLNDVTSPLGDHLAVVYIHLLDLVSDDTFRRA